MLNIGAGELAVLVVVALFVLGPERLPGAIRWAAGVAGHIKSYVAAAKEQISAPEFDELRQPLNDLREPLEQLRAADPRRAVREALRSSATTHQPPTTSSSPAPSSPPAPASTTATSTRDRT